MADPIAFAASADPDTMYYHQALKEPDAANRLKLKVEATLKASMNPMVWLYSILKVASTQDGVLRPMVGSL